MLFDVRWRLLPLGVVLIGVIWAFGLVGYLGVPLTLVTISGLPVMLGIGIDYAIQMHARVEEEVVIDHAEHPIQESARNLGPALLVVTFDAIFAFAALHFSKVPMIRDFGILLAIGVAAICLCSIVGPLAALGIREYKSPTQGPRLPRGPARPARGLARRPAEGRRPPPSIVGLARDLRRRSARRGPARDPDRPDRVGQPGLRPRSATSTRSSEQAGISSELGHVRGVGEPFSDKSVEFVDRFTDQQLCKLRRRRRASRRTARRREKAVAAAQARARQRVEHREHRELPDRGAGHEAGPADG